MSTSSLVPRPITAGRGSLELQGDELPLHVNSDERLATAKIWLLAVPAVRFAHSAAARCARR